MAVNLGHVFAMMVSMQAEQEIWLRHYAGNFAAQASVQSKIQSISGILSFLLNPVIASISDHVGRKPLMVAASVMSMLRSVMTASHPSVFTTIVGDFVRPFTMS